MAHVEHAELDAVKQTFGGELTPAEVQFLRRIQELFRAVLSQRRGFNIVIEIIAVKLLKVIKAKLDLNVRANVDVFLLEKSIGENIPVLGEAERAITHQEEEFAKDVIAVVDFAVRNSIGFALIANVLSHDITEIFNQGSLDNAAALGFYPKVGGWAHYDRESIGEPDEAEE